MWACSEGRWAVGFLLCVIWVMKLQILCHCVFSVSAMQTLSCLSYRSSLAVHSAVFSFSDCQQGARSISGILSMKCNPFGVKGKAQEKRWGCSLIQYFVLFQVVMTSLSWFLSSCGEGSIYGEYIPRSMLRWFSLHRRSHFVSVKEVAKTQLLHALIFAHCPEELWMCLRLTKEFLKDLQSQVVAMRYWTTPVLLLMLVKLY